MASDGELAVHYAKIANTLEILKIIEKSATLEEAIEKVNLLLESAKRQ